MGDWPQGGVTAPRIRPTQSGVRSGRRVSRYSPHRVRGDSQNNQETEPCYHPYQLAEQRYQRAQRFCYDETQRRYERSGRGQSPAPASPPRQPLHSRKKRSLAKPRSASRTWLAAAFTMLVAMINRDSGRGVSSMYEALLAERDWEVQGERAAHLTMEIFSAPKPFIGGDGIQQTRAIESWLGLQPRPQVTLLGTGAGYAGVVKRYGLNWNPHIDTSFLGVPLFNAIVEVANASEADVAVVINADILLFDDFPFAVRKVHRDISLPWMLVGARWDVSELPPHLLKLQKYRRRKSSSERQDIGRFARKNGTLHTYGGVDVWAWNTRTGTSLFDGIMPHFVFGRGKYDNWLTHEVLSAGRRHVVDVSEACTFVHVLHDHHLVTDASGGNIETWGNFSLRRGQETESKRAFWNQGARVKFELYINTYLAAAHGSYASQMGTILHAPIKLQSCYEAEGLCLFQRVRPHSCRCEHSPFVPAAQSDPFAINDSRLVFCGLLSSDSQSIHDSSDQDTLFRFVVSGRPRAYESLPSSSSGVISNTGDQAGERDPEDANASLHGALLEVASKDEGSTGRFTASEMTSAFGLPLLLEKLLTVIERRTGTKRIVLTVLNSNSKSLLPRFTCSARRAGVFPSVVIAALDDETYHFAITRGYAVYLEESIYETVDEEVRVMGSRYDSPGFGALLSVRARIVRRLTSLGREVFYADPDVALVQDPFSSVPDEADVAFLTRDRAGKYSDLRHGEDAGRDDERFISAAMLYARPSKTAEGALTQLGRVELWKRPTGGAIEAALRTHSIRYWMLPRGKFQNFPGVLPPLSDREGAVAVHLGVVGDAHTKADLWRRAGDLHVYDEMREVCFPGATTRSSWLNRARAQELVT